MSKWVHGWHDSGYPESGGEKQPGWFWKKLNTVKGFGSLELFHNMVNLPDTSNQRFTTVCRSFHLKLKCLKPFHKRHLIDSWRSVYQGLHNKSLWLQDHEWKGSLYHPPMPHACWMVCGSEMYFHCSLDVSRVYSFKPFMTLLHYLMHPKNESSDLHYLSPFLYDLHGYEKVHQLHLCHYHYTTIFP